MSPDTIRIHKDDSVGVVLRSCRRGETLTFGEVTITLTEEIPAGHKVALKPIRSEEDVLKYGHVIGRAKREIRPGEWVHTHNLETRLEGTQTYRYRRKTTSRPVQKSSRTFRGYVREDGNVGIRNEIWIINTVGCINKTAELLARTANESFAGDGLDGVYHFPHPYGCSQLGDDLKNTQKVLANLVKHPNAAGVLVIGLGCENNHIASFQEVLGPVDGRRVKFMAVQDVSDELEDGMVMIEELAQYAKTFQRQSVPLSKLAVGLKCGGSDGLSGITANPLVGTLADRIVSEGGTVLLTEVPEMFGAEEILLERASDEEVFNKTVRLVNNFKEYFLNHGQPVSENPSPGNKEGGITTLEEKSLGCVQKGGFSPVADVLAYGERYRRPGLQLVQGPGNDLVSVTTLATAGAQLVLFTTGRGTPYGGPVPTMKISTNTQLARKKKNWIDFDAEPVLERKEEVEEALFEEVIRIASGEKRTRNEIYGFKEIAIFKDGVTL
ncbi:D-altronate dehydratase [Melghirimyces profundicolus]|uniref:D-altronate dehydratase n=1 Tax=Melghirimyces profundicolus TaxID=1242148 RepID=A0A2T6BD22_9BACL|nr:altronate dehydratase family protein [Melghirimyces profundicolus]PTX53978.1 D-altronate dehydratase [Melghirimyces profundicolus]